MMEPTMTNESLPPLQPQPQENSSMMHGAVPASRVAGRVIIGLTLIAVGMIFMLDNLGYVDAGEFWRWWPVVLIGIGIGQVIQEPLPGQPRQGVWMIVIGLWLLVSMLELFGLDFGNSWPLLIVAAGLTMIFNARKTRANA
jgi:hypothetical protein